MPRGALYWLRDLSKGKEERIFSYEDGKQVWWWFLFVFLEICLLCFGCNRLGFLIACETARTFCTKWFSVLRQSIPQSSENDFRTYWHLSYELFHTENPIRKKHGCPWDVLTLSHFTQTVFLPKRFASFRLLLYQHFKVNFLPLHPSPEFHRKMKNDMQIPDLQI